MVWGQMKRPLWLRCAVGVLIAILAAFIRWHFLGVLEFRVVFLTFYPAVAVAALYGGVAAGLPATVASVALADYFWIEPVGQFAITELADLISMIVFLASATLISCMAETTYRAQARANKAEEQARLLAERERAEERMREQRERLKVTLASIGDGVLSTDTEGKVTFINPVAAVLTGRTLEEAFGQPVQSIFRTINEKTRAPADDIVERVLKEGNVVNPANHTVLVTPDGREIPIEDSAAPIKDSEGKVLGAVLVFHDVTESRRARQALQESEKLYRSLFDNMLNGFAYCKMLFEGDSPKDFIYLNVNSSFEALTGLGEVIGKKVSQVIPGIQKSDPDLLEAYGRVARTGVPEKFEIYLQSLGQWFSISVYSPQEEHFVTLFDVITERKLAEKEILRAKIEWERTFDCVPDLIAVVDTRHRIVRANREMTRRLGVGPETCVGMPCYESIHGSTEPPMFCPHSQSLKDGKEHVVEVHEEHLGGDFLVSATPLIDEKGEMIGTVHVARDITERKQMEDELRKSRDELELRVQERTLQLSKVNRELEKEMEERKQAAAAIKVERQRLFDVLETLPVYVCLMAPDYHVPFVNRVFRERFGESKGGTSRCFEHLFGRGDPCETCEPHKVLNTMAPNEWEWTGPDTRTYSVFDFPFTDTDGSRLILEMGIDITERKQAEVALSEMVARLEQSNQALQDFASIASHDLQEPLRKVISFGNMLKHKYNDRIGQTGNDYLNRMLDATQRMQSLLKGLLEYSRITMLGDPFVRVDLNKIVSEVLSDLEIRIQSTSAEVQVEGLPVVDGDPTQMRQVFQNLIGNALKFHKKGEKPVIKVRSLLVEGKLQVAIEDNGIGFEEHFIEKIFAPFQRLHGRSSRYEGTGMGLAICKKIVERHGGRITAKSTPSVGTSFILELPMRPS